MDSEEARASGPHDIQRVLALIDDVTVPASTDEVIESLGDVEVRYEGGGSERLRSVLRVSGIETYDTVDELRSAVLNGVPSEAVGRPRYSDRDPPDVAADRPDEQSL